MSRRILIVDDDQAMCEMLDDDLSHRGYSIRCHTRAEEAFEDFMANPFDTVVTDLRMPGLHGIDFCRQLTDNRPDVPVIVITAFGSLQTAVEAIRAGAYDFVTKPIELDMLAIVIARALEHRSLREQIRFLKQQQWQSKDFNDFIGKSAVMERLFEQITRVANQQVPVLISGESGTGKELVAQALHQRSDRRDKPFVPVNCAAVPGMLLESELFGHRRGSFTDARSDRQGLFLAAHDGTLFLDEIAEMPLELQPKLLRVLESGSVRPIGENREIPSDVRILAATNQDLDSAVRQGDFRQDLFFRVNVVHIEVPPLRSRGFDILLLAKHFLQQIAQRNHRPVKGFSYSAADKLLAYHWPGNVRELRNAMERAVAMARLEELTVEDLPERIRNYQRTSSFVAANTTDELIPLEDFERQYVEHVLGKVGGNKSEAARILGLGRRTLYRKMERWGL
jgi:DNA-binding NtrC family response regulator